MASYLKMYQCWFSVSQKLKQLHSQVIFFHTKMKLMIHLESQIFTLTQQVFQSFPGIITICILSCSKIHFILRYTENYFYNELWDTSFGFVHRTKVFHFILAVVLFRGQREATRGQQWPSRQFIPGPRVSIMWFQYIVQGHLGSALKVFWNLLLLPEHLRRFVCTGARTWNPLCLSPVPNRLSIYLRLVKDRRFHFCVFPTREPPSTKMTTVYNSLL